jgi:hypothetical protein
LERERRKQARVDVLVPLIDCVIVLEDWLDIKGTKKAFGLSISVIDIETDEGMFRSHITA